VARGDRKRGRAAFKRRDTLFQHRVGRIGDAGIDVAETLQPKKRSRVIDVVENKRRCLVDGRGACAGGWIGLGARVNGKRCKARPARFVLHLVLP
jgi:hypothetical protein